MENVSWAVLPLAVVTAAPEIGAHTPLVTFPKLTPIETVVLAVPSNIVSTAEFSVTATEAADARVN